MATAPENLFEAGATYVVLRDEAALRDNFAKGQRLIYWKHAYSFYDGLHGWFFYDENQNVLAWDKPEADPEARDALFAKVKSDVKPSPHSVFIPCKSGDVERLRAALKEGVPPRMVRKQSFEFACHARSIGCMLLLAGIPGLDEEELGDFLRHTAAEGFTLGVQALLDMGIPVNAADEYGQTALINAAWGGDVNLVDLLLARGADATLKMTTGNCALTFARTRHHDAAASRIAQALEFAESTSSSPSRMPPVPVRKGSIPQGSLLSACKKGDERAARSALSQGNVPPKERRAAFEAACHTPSFACVNLLIQHAGTDTGELSCFLLVAAEVGYAPGVQALLNTGLPVDTTDEHGQTALFHAARNGDLDLVELLLYRGADVNARSDEGQTAIDAAKESGKKTLTRRLEQAAKNAPNAASRP